MEKVLLLPRENLIEKVAEHIITKNVKILDFSHLTIIFPNKRPKYFLFKALNDRIREAFFPPNVLSMDEFIEKIFERLFPQFRSPSFIESIYLLYGIFKKFPKLLAEPEYEKIFIDFGQFYPFGIKIFEAFEELYIENITSEKLKSVESLINFYKFLSKIYEEFYTFLEKERLATRAFKYRKVAEELRVDLFSESSCLIFCGNFGLTKVEKKFFEKISNLYEKKEISGYCAQWLYSDSEDDKPVINIYESPDRHGQVYMVGSLLNKNENLINEKTVIVLPSEDLLFPLLRQGIPNLNEESYNISMGYPVMRTPLWSLFESLSELLNSMVTDENSRVLFPVSEYLHFVLHPYVKNTKFDDDPTITRALFHCLESYLSEEEGVIVCLDEIEEALLDKVLSKADDLQGYVAYSLKNHLKNIHNILIRPFFSIRNVKDFSKKCIDVLKFIYEKTTAPGHPLFFPFYSTFLNKFEEISNSLLKDLILTDFSGYFNLLKSHIKNLTTPFEGVPVRGLQILGFLETRNLNFKNVFFVDLNEEIFPPLYEDYLLPLKVREALGLPTFKDREKLIEYHFRTLINGAETIRLFYVKDEKKERSRFIEKLIWESEKKRKKVTKRTVNYRVNLSADKPIGVRKESKHIEYLKNLVYTPSSIDVYIKCPLKFYYLYLLGLREKEDKEIDSAQIGTIVHKILISFFERLKDRGDLSKCHMDTTVVEKLAEEEFKKKYGDYLYGSLYLIKRQITKRVREILENYYFKIISRSSFRVLAVEETFSTTFKEVTISGRIDMVENRAEKIVLVDYKISGKEDSYKINFERLTEIIKDYENQLRSGSIVYFSNLASKAFSSIQMPLYFLGYSWSRNISFNKLEGVYLILGKPKIDESIEFNPFKKSPSFEEAIALTKTTVSKIIDELLNPDIPFYPTKDFRENCQYCELRTICGTLWVQKRD